MNTDDLILELAKDTRPVRSWAVGRRIFAGICIGAVVSTILLIAVLGPRSDLSTAMRGYSYWVKWAYTLSLSVAAMSMTIQLAKPGTGPLRGLWVTGVPVVLLAGIGLMELLRAPPSEWLGMWLGRSWMICPWLVLILALPIFAGLLWSFRKLAPTRLRAAGATAGLTAGAFAASVYCLHCPEVSAIFVLTWYSLGILLVTLIGALLGPRLLRW